MTIHDKIYKVIMQLSTANSSVKILSTVQFHYQ